MLRQLLSVAFLVAFVTTASAQPKLPSVAALLAQIRDDAQAALADANQHEDRIAAPCYAAIVDMANVKLQAHSVAGGGVILVFQKLRDLARLNATPQGTSLIVGCAPLAQDAKLTLLDFLTKIGAAVLAKGVLL